ncbi:hypothetical protein [Chryseosolibacter indicus]|uniref:Uncharacterized protein n=1 Tax=Chryseosolibacter indicus TaxID=2782351 RepID=A0ABS5VW13_9BACT|nr:hypothetical protein [Chryseosolibacter indicus]MBT1705609.1 hypothetical protein [Chryseosolibacter indicus]
MATIQGNPMIKGVRGALRGIMFRQVGKRTILSAKPSSPKKQSEQQRANRYRFKCASNYAKHILKDEQKKAYYQQKARKLKMPNAYTAALSDYMRKGEIKQIKINTNSKSGDSININVYKKDFAVNKVRVTIYDKEGTSVFSDFAIKKDRTDFVLPISKALLLTADTRIKATIEDNFMDRIERTIN